MNDKKWLSNEDYDFIFDRVPRLCVDLVIKTENGILLFLRDIEPCKGQWCLPGGMVYKDETIEDALHRILKKETGWKSREIRMLWYMEFLHENQNGNDRHSVSIVFEIEPGMLYIKLDAQASKFKVFTKIPENMQAVHGEFLRQKGIFK